jgi:hypothetical protein
MDKKALYEHLANIYLDASTKRKSKKPRKHPDFFKRLFFISLVLIGTLSIMLVSIPFRYKSLINSTDNVKLTQKEFVLSLEPGIVKINFNFGPAKEESYSLNLDQLDLDRFKELAFLVRKAKFQDSIILKIEFANALNESSRIYINEIPSFKWKEVRLRLSDFKDISDWNSPANVSFIVNESGVNTKQGIIYIDNVRLIK